MSNRRQFLGTLGRIMGGGLLLPIAGKGALSLSDVAEAAQLPVTLSPLPFSADCLELRRIKGALASVPDHAYPGKGGPWYRLMTEEYRPTAWRVARRPVESWADCVELAEIVWSFHEKEQADGPSSGPYTGRLLTGRDWYSDAVAALAEGVLTLGNGERFDPRMR